MERVASAWNVPPSRGILMVGDSLANDIGFGVAAGVSTAFLNVGGLCGDGSGGAHATGEISSGVITTNSNAAEPPGPVPAPPSRTATSTSTSSLPPPVAASLLSPDITVTRLIDLPRAVFQRFELRGPLGSTAGLKKFETPEPDTDACRAAAAGDASAVIAAGPAALHERDSCGNTPLVWAADRGHVECVARLVAANADVNAKGFLCATAVARASRRGHAEVLEILVRHYEIQRHYEIHPPTLECVLHMLTDVFCQTTVFILICEALLICRIGCTELDTFMYFLQVLRSWLYF